MNRRSMIRTMVAIMIGVVFTTSTCFGASDVTLKGYNTVPTLTQGQSYSIHGTIESKKKMTRVEVGVVSVKENKWVIKYDKNINSSKFNVASADTSIKFGTLKAGTYKYRIYAHVGKKVYTLLNQQFVVKAKPIKIKTVKEQQTFLNKVNMGSIIGTLVIDGQAGSKTIASIKIFQQIEGLEVDGIWGAKTEAASNKSIKVNGTRKAMNWACSVANDNSFAYGTGKRAHRSGCYFCKTNTGTRKYKKEKKGEPHYVKDSNGKKHTYEKTYCCNTFITAAYAHGAKDSKTYDYCHAGSCFGMTPAEWERSKNFKRVGKAKSVAYSKLVAGDVIINKKSAQAPHHVWMYIGHGRIVESSGGTWSAKSISVKNNAKSKYAKYQKSNTCYVMRYTK